MISVELDSALDGLDCGDGFIVVVDVVGCGVVVDDDSGVGGLVLSFSCDPAMVAFIRGAIEGLPVFGAPVAGTFGETVTF